MLSHSGFLVGEDGFEPSKRYAADLQSVPFGHSGTPPYSTRLSEWSRQTDSNPRPADYKSAALPTELCRRLKQNTLIIARCFPFVKSFFLQFQRIFPPLSERENNPFTEQTGRPRKPGKCTAARYPASGSAFSATEPAAPSAPSHPASPEFPPPGTYSAPYPAGNSRREP